MHFPSFRQNPHPGIFMPYRFQGVSLLFSVRTNKKESRPAFLPGKIVLLELQSSSMEKYIFELIMKVRDYECDLQGIVNNANYQHYLEHTRHEFLAELGVSFARIHEQGIDPVVARIHMAFKTPLKSGDEFVSRLYLKKEGIKYVFYQDIYRLADRKLSVQATVETVCLVGGRLSKCELFDRLFASCLTE